MLNLILTLSNAHALLGFWTFRRAPLASSLLLIAGFASALYHSVEQQKHSMSGLWGGPHHHTACLLFDRVAALSLGGYLLFYIPRTPSALGLGCSALIFCALSELPWKFQLFRDPVFERNWYFCWHLLWHLSAFHFTFLCLSV